MGELGVGDEHVKPIAYPIHGIRLVTRRGHEAWVSAGDQDTAAVCLRHEFDYALHRAALAHGARFASGFKAREAILAGERFAGVRAADGREARARFVVIASGANATLTPERGPKRAMQTVMGWWEGVPFRPHH